MSQHACTHDYISIDEYLEGELISKIKHEYIDGEAFNQDMKLKLDNEYRYPDIMRRKNQWQSERFYLGDSIDFEAIDLSLSVSEIYDRVGNEDMLAFLQQREKEEQS